MKLSLMLSRIALALLLLLPAATSAQDLDTAVSALVRISGTRSGTPVRGSGFVIGIDRDKATIVTASHVIEGVRQLEVSFAVDQTESFPTGSVLGMEAGNPRGLAVFQVRGTLPPGLMSLSFETEAFQLRRGDDVFVLGFPEMATEPVALRMSFAGPDGNALRLDRPAGEGISGAPVLREGKVVGIVTDEDLRLTYAIKATVAQGAVIGWGARLGGSSIQASTPIEENKPTPQVVKGCEPGKVRTENGIDFVRICPGTFIMGSAEHDPRAKSEEKPAHQVTLSEFWIGKTEITNKQYRRFRRNHKGSGELPATNITWDEAKGACRSFGGDLPTEAQWEYAARASSLTAWSFGEDETQLSEYAWFGVYPDTPHPVGMKKPNAWGLYDMLGNVWEWVADWFGPYPVVAQTNPTGPANGKIHLGRGGSFLDVPTSLRTANRFRANPDFPEYRGENFGFRCVLPRRSSS